MDTGQPTQDDKELVNRNNQLNQDSNQPVPPQQTLSNPQSPSQPSAPPSTPPPSAAPPTGGAPPPTPTPSPPPAPQANKPIPPPEPPEEEIPLQQPDQQNVGIGTPNIGVEKNQVPQQAPQEENKEFKIEVAAYDPPQQKPTPSGPPPLKTENEETPAQVKVKNYQNPEQAQTTPANTPQPPVKAPGANTSFVVATIFALILGSAGGFLGFRYWDKLKTAASTEATPETSKAPSLDVKSWQEYRSSIENYSLKYPNGWLASTTDPQAESVVFASNKESLEGEPTGYKIEVNYQNSNDKTLKSWVEANAAAMGENKKPKEITVSGQTAYQQELSKTGPKVATYIERPSKIMIVTYSAPESLFGEGGDWYNNLINSINLT